MSHVAKKLDQSQIELTITVTPEEYSKHLPKAADKISARTAIKGFRKGKTPYEILKREVGEMAILQEALEQIIQESFFNAVQVEKLDTIGMPQISVQQVAPGNELVYKAVVALMPTIEIGDIKKIKVKKTTKSIEEKEINETIDALRGMQAKEVTKDGAAAGTDKLIIDMEMYLDKVLVDGGSARDYQVYLSEDHYVPGFNDEVKGLKKGDSKEFALNFPDTHYQKMLAGKKVDFKVTVKDVIERQLPELDEEFAKRLGQDSVEKLRDLLRRNMETEAERKAEQQFEIELFDAVIAASTFGPIPEVIIDAERQKMFYELKRDLDKHGVSIEQYLADIKKNEAELFADFKSQAEKRAKAALISRAVAQTEKLSATPEEIDAELKLLKETYKDDKEYMDRLDKREVKDTLATIIQNRKVLEWLKKAVTT